VKASDKPASFAAASDEPVALAFAVAIALGSVDLEAIRRFWRCCEGPVSVRVGAGSLLLTCDEGVAYLEARAQEAVATGRDNAPRSAGVDHEGVWRWRRPRVIVSAMGGELRGAAPWALGVALLACGGATDQEIPNGWARSADLHPECRLYVPSSKDLLPAALQWKPCEADVGLPHLACRQMIDDGSPADEYLPFVRGAWADPDGPVILMFARTRGAGMEHLVAEADGPVRQSIFEASNNCCPLKWGTLTRRRFAYLVEWEETRPAGRVSTAFAGHVDVLPPHTVVREFSSLMNLIPTDSALMVLTSDRRIELHPWDKSAVTFVSSSAQDGELLQNGFVAQADALFWQANSISEPFFDKLRVFTPEQGTRDFISFGEDRSRGAASLGTDGHDLVWLERSAQPPLAPTVAMMTAPFTTNPAELRRRWLHSEDDFWFRGSPFTVGCGFAARTTYLVQGGRSHLGVLITRLSDGVAWLLPYGGPGAWRWEAAHAITCTEVFVMAKVSTPTPHRVVARVRLDSLGPGIPPD
jgi:hypothetical protein